MDFDTEQSSATITFQVTDKCNLQCTYCYQIHKGNHVMPFEIAKEFIDLLLKNDPSTQFYMNTREIGSVILDFIGGEPLLEIELIDRIIDYFQEAAIREDHPWQYYFKVSMASNGTLYFSPEVQKFIKKHQHHLSFSVSVDGNKELHDACRVFPDGKGSYDLAIAAVHHYKQTYGDMPSIKMTFAPENLPYLNESYQYLISEGYKDLHGNCVYLSA